MKLVFLLALCACGPDLKKLHADDCVRDCSDTARACELLASEKAEACVAQGLPGDACTRQGIIETEGCLYQNEQCLALCVQEVECVLGKKSKCVDGGDL
jgi:hypothetical protein